MTQQWRLSPVALIWLGAFGFCGSVHPVIAAGNAQPDCATIVSDLNIDVTGDVADPSVTTPPTHTCSVSIQNGFPVPDPTCTPGAVNPSLTWPQCGPSDVDLNDRFFKHKDLVENYLAALVKAKRFDLATTQHCIAQDWTQYLDEARAHCSGTKCDVRDVPARTGDARTQC